MLIQVVSVWVKPDCVDLFIEATRLNREGTRKEPGNVRFDVSQSIKDPAFFTLYEAFKHEAALEFHRQSRHYLAWRETVAPMMQKPREGQLHHSLFSEES